MRIVVAGGSGLVGRHLVRELVGRGDDVMVLSRRPRRARPMLPDRAEVAAWDPTAGARPLVGPLSGSDGVVNLAGTSVGSLLWTGGTKRAIRESRLQATDALVGALAMLPAERRPLVLVSASGTHMYEGLDSEPATEAMAPTDDNFLGRLCLDWETAAMRARELGLRVVLLRTGLVLAPGAPSLERLLLPFRMFVGGTPDSGAQWLSVIAIDDAVGLIVHALRAWDICGPLNLAAPEPVRQRDFARLAADVLRRPAQVRIPAWLVRLVLGEQATLAVGSRRIVPTAALRSGYQFRITSLDQALRTAVG